MNNLTIILSTLFFLTFLYSEAQPENKPRKRFDRVSLGASTSISIKGYKFEGTNSTTTENTSTAAAIATVGYDFSGWKVAAGFGQHRTKQVTTYSGNSNSQTETKSGPIFQVGVWKTFSLAESVKKSLDLGVGIFGVYGGGNVEYQNVSTGPMGLNTNISKEDNRIIAVSPGIRPEWFVSEHISFHTQIGVLVSILNEGNSAYSEGGVNLHIFKASDLLGQAGFSFYF